MDFEEKKAYVRKVDVDYYTDASLAVILKVLDVFQTSEEKRTSRSWGDVMVTSLVTMFKKIKFDTHENLGWGQVHLPELELQTTAYWMTLNEVPVSIHSQDDLQNGLMGIANVESCMTFICAGSIPEVPAKVNRVSLKPPGVPLKWVVRAR